MTSGFLRNQFFPSCWKVRQHDQSRNWSTSWELCILLNHSPENKNLLGIFKIIIFALPVNLWKQSEIPHISLQVSWIVPFLIILENFSRQIHCMRSSSFHNHTNLRYPSLNRMSRNSVSFPRKQRFRCITLRNIMPSRFRNWRSGVEGRRLIVC